MKSTNNYFFTGIFTLLAGNIFAGQVDKGIEFNEAGMYETAKVFLLEGIQSEPTARAYYYLGDTYLMLNKEDSAAYYFDKSTVADPKYFLPLVGEGKLLLKKNDKTAAEEKFKQAMKEDKKNPAIYTEIAAAYLENNLLDNVPPLYEKAYSVKRNYPAAFIVEGDMLAKMGKTGEACPKYANAYYFDSKYKLAYLKEARAYKSINTARALELLDDLTAIDADYTPAYIEYVELYYYHLKYFKKAVPAYEKFVDLPGIATKDLENYATVLYFEKEYLRSLDEIKKVLQTDPNNFVMRRLEFYNHLDLDNNEIALSLGAKFFASKGESDKYIVEDYILFAKLLSSNKQDIEAIEYYKKALELDSTKIEFYKEISTAYEKAENYVDAIAYYQKYMDSSENPKASEYYSFGRSYYQASTQMGIKGDTIAQKEYMLKADSLFAIVTEKNDESYLGYIWRARSLASLDPELAQGLAKPLYEQTSEILLKEGDIDKRKKELTECYMYLGNYHYLKKDKENTLIYFNKVLELNPLNKEMEKVVKELYKK